MQSYRGTFVRLVAASATVLSVLGSPPTSNGNSTLDTYDYIVVGSGPGGGIVASNLALAGYSVKLIEAGRDASNETGTYVSELQYPEDDEIKWSFFVDTTTNITQQLRYRLLTWTLPNGTYWVGSGEDAPEDATLNGVYYPRGATLGGSAVVNAMAFVMPNDATWYYIANSTGDETWSHESMRSIFEQIERNHYLPRNTSGHGFDGYVDSSIDASSFYEQEPGRLALLDQVVQSLIGNLTGTDNLLWYLQRDTNPDSPGRDLMAEPFGLAKHENGMDRRWSPRDLIHHVVNTTDTLTLQLESLATRVLFDNVTSGSEPRAIGVEFLAGAGVYGATWKYDKTTAPKGTLKRAYARKEVIISGGTFNSPQLLQLSGIGNATHLSSVGIEPLVSLPGVGLNLRDNEELPVAGHSPVNITETLTDPEWANCTYGASGDPCLALWYQGTGPYAEPQGNSECAFLKTNHSPDGTRDVITFAPPGVFRGFYPTTGQTTEGLFTDPLNTLWRSIARMDPQNNAGWVRITTADPTAVPDININHYAAEPPGSDDVDVDLGAMVDALAWIRRALLALPAPYGPVTRTSEPPCAAGYGADGYCADRAEDEQWIRDQTFGHHPVGTCKLGPAGDAAAVVDARFRVHGVRGLRVVDASVFPISPGGFPVLASMLVGEKGSRVILEDARLG